MEEMARFPDPHYTCRQASSFDRRSVSPDSLNWFGNHDGYNGGNFDRVDTIDGRIEKVMLDHQGPGVITRIGIPGAGPGLAIPHTSYSKGTVGGSTSFFPIPYAKSWYGEGDEKIWVDQEKFPSHIGTGTEDYYNSSWAPVVVSKTPFGGAIRADTTSSQGYNTWLRTRNLDGIPFRSKMKFDFELLSCFRGTADYSSTVYWYGDLDAKAEGTSGIDEARRELLPAIGKKDGR